MGRGKRNNHTGAPRSVDVLDLSARTHVRSLVENRLAEVAALRDEGRYHPPLSASDEIHQTLELEVGYQLDRIGKASIKDAEELVQARFAEAGIELLGSELADGRFHAEDRAYVVVRVRYDDLEAAWELARALGDEMDPEELSGAMVQCGDLSADEYMARVNADRAARTL